ncbi:MAG: hypothetical protein JNL11_09460 [Bdellovibrionaceae bacterium]|nr:hypothetical protein [Pseudobdellovibrionaceae bacterium]
MGNITKKYLVNTRWKKMFFPTAVAFVLVLLWQNCGQVRLEKVDEASRSQSSLSAESALKIFPENRDRLRLTLILDMSQSMYSGPCQDSIDTLIDDVNPLSCISPTGVDPEGKRFRLAIKWIEALEDKVKLGILKYEDLKVLVQPFSNALMEKNWTLENTYNSRGTLTSLSRMNSYIQKLTIAEKIQPGFISLKAAKYYIYLLWGVFNNLQSEPYPRDIPNDVVNVLPVLTSTNMANAQGHSTGTSMVQPAIVKVNSVIYNELDELRKANVSNKSYFEIVLLSDGVPKPHPIHMKKVIEYVWQQKKEVCDVTEYGPAFRSCADDTSVSTGWKNVDATLCSQKCSNYLQRYVDEGGVVIPEGENSICTSRASNNKCLSYSIPESKVSILPDSRWLGKNMTCTQCFEVLKQYKYNTISCPQSSCSSIYSADTFKTDIVSVWGDWIFNNHVYILQSLKEMENIFINKFTESKFHLNFLRVNSNVLAYETSPGELSQDLNWIVKAYAHFGKKYAFSEFKTLNSTPEIFPEFSEVQKYRLGVVYAFNRNVYSDDKGHFHLDVDGDGVIDSLEAGSNPALIRTDGICLDSIKKRFGQCLNLGCDPSVDRDSDGLNECEEKTLGTDDFSEDSDKDSLLDWDEVLMGFNPMDNDQKLYFSNDGMTNFEHFLRGFSFRTNLRSIDESKQIKLNVDYKSQVKSKSSQGIEYDLPVYKIGISQLPFIVNENKKDNEIVVRLRIDNVKNSMSSYWYTKSYFINNQNKILTIDLSEFAPLKKVDKEGTRE